MPTIPLVTFNNGVEIPQVGFGVFLVPADETKAAVSAALDIGYRHIDTARLYGTRPRSVRRSRSRESPRDELFVTTKCWNY